jgi:hypothetical protein
MYPSNIKSSSAPGLYVGECMLLAIGNVIGCFAIKVAWRCAAPLLVPLVFYVRAAKLLSFQVDVSP